LYKEPDRINNVEIVKITPFFPSFGGEKENELMIEEVSKEKLKSILACFRKDKIFSPDGW